MTDRELLELAAKAMGIGPLDFDYAEREGHHFYMGPRLPMPQGVLMAAMWTYWCPMEDDADALRLAVALGINIYLAEKGFVMASKFGIQGFRAELGADPDKAVRHMIVRAAAEIAKAMP